MTADSASLSDDGGILSHCTDNLENAVTPPGRGRLASVTIGALEDWDHALEPAARRVIAGDARKIALPDDSVDLVVTSPPYWQKRDYGHEAQIGLESTPTGYVSAILDCLKEWRRILRPTGSVFLNIGDTYQKRSLVGIPGRIEAAAVDGGWMIRNRIISAEDGGMPEPARNRLANRHEYIVHLRDAHRTTTTSSAIQSTSVMGLILATFGPSILNRTTTTSSAIQSTSVMGLIPATFGPSILSGISGPILRRSHANSCVGLCCSPGPLRSVLHATHHGSVLSPEQRS